MCFYVVMTPSEYLVPEDEWETRWHAEQMAGNGQSQRVMYTVVHFH